LVDGQEEISYNDIWEPFEVEALRDLIYDEVQLKAAEPPKSDLLTMLIMSLGAFGIGRRMFENKDLVMEKVRGFLDSVSKNKRRLWSLVRSHRTS